MANRILKDSINESRGLTSCTFFAQDLYKRLITYADDYGRFNADPQIMLARLYPRELDVVLIDDIISGIIELAGVGKVCFYTSQCRNDVYGAFPNWASHQRVRDSKKKMPDPANTAVNDWYLRRFIPIDMRAAIIQRDGFKCCICGKHLSTDIDAKKFAKNGSGLYHIDHIVPVVQGGRATMENLRLTCPSCNQSRKKQFSFDEILQFAETCRESPRTPASCGLNPIQSESESESNPNPDDDARARLHTVEAYASGNLQYLSPGNMEELGVFKSDLPDDVIRFAIDEACANGAPRWSYVAAILRGYVQNGVRTVGDAKEAKEKHKGRADRSPQSNPALNYAQREYKAEDFGDDFFIDLDKYGEGT